MAMLNNQRVLVLVFCNCNPVLESKDEIDVPWSVFWNLLLLVHMMSAIVVLLLFI